MEASTSTSITSISSDVWASEILPWLSYGQLTKMARVSKKFADIVKKVGPFTIDTFHEGWLDGDRVQHVERCRSLSLNERNLSILEHLARVKELQLEYLDVQNIKSDDKLANLLATIIKNHKGDSLKVLKVPVINFNKIAADNAICTSLTTLVIGNYGGDGPIYSVEMADVLKVFPSLKRIQLVDSPKTDLYKYLTEHLDTPIESVYLTGSDMEHEGNIAANLKVLDVYLNFPTDKLDALQNLKNLTHLRVNFGWREEKFKLPKLKKLEWLDISSDQPALYCQAIEYAQNLTYLAANQKMIDKLALPQSLKSISTRILDEAFNPAKLTKLPNLESISLEHDASTFWAIDKGGLAKTVKKLNLEGYKIGKWTAKMNVFANLTHFTLKEANMKEIPGEFFDSCPKLVHFELANCSKIDSISPKIKQLTELEAFVIRKCALKSIPEGLKDLQRLQLIDLRNNPFDKDCVVPLTLPVKTTPFKDREWIQIIQNYLKDSKVPTVTEMFKLPYLPSYTRLVEEGRLARVLLNGLGVKDAPELETNDNSSLHLAGALMRQFRNFDEGLEDDPERLARNPPEYHAKEITVGIILFNEYNVRNDLHLKLVQVVPTRSHVKTYALGVSDDFKTFWKLEGLIHEFKGVKVTQKEKKFIRVVVGR